MIDIQEWYDNKSANNAQLFLQKLCDYFPFAITKVLTDNGKEFTDKFNNKDKKPTSHHIFDKTCQDNDIEHRLTKPYTPKTNGMVERVNGNITRNVLQSVKFDSFEDMKHLIFQYLYHYNHHIKHSFLRNKTPMSALKKLYLDNLNKLSKAHWNDQSNDIDKQVDFKYNYNDFMLKATMWGLTNDKPC